MFGLFRPRSLPASYAPPSTEGLSPFKAAEAIHDAACAELESARARGDERAMWRAVGRCEVAFDALITLSGSDSDTRPKAGDAKQGSTRE